MFRFTCHRCGQEHEGIPAFHAKEPLAYHGVPKWLRWYRCLLTTDTCVIDKRWYFVRGCLDIPINDSGETFTWGVWASLSKENFDTFLELYEEEEREHEGPLFGWLSTRLPGYPETLHLKTSVHLRNHGIRPFIELEATDHPLAVEQREGITRERLVEINELVMHTD